MKDLTSKRVIITGASGMVGSHIVAELLSKGYTNITVTMRSAESLQRFHHKMERLGIDCSTIESQDVELLNPHEVNTLLKDCDLLIHCAAQVSLGSGDGRSMIETNTRITSVLVDCALKNNIGAMVHISSIATFESREYPQPTDESAFARSLNGWGPYAKSKFYSENQVWRGIRSGLNAIIVNPSVILGADSWNDGSSAASLLKKLSHGFPFYTEGATGYVDVRDVARATVMLTENEQAYGERYLISTHNLTHHQLMNLMADRLRVRRPWIKCSRSLLYTAAAIENIFSFLTFRTPQLSRSMVRSVTSRSAYSSQKLKNTTGFEYRSLEDTLEYLIKNFRSQTT